MFQLGNFYKCWTYMKAKNKFTFLYFLLINSILNSPKGSVLEIKIILFSLKWKKMRFNFIFELIFGFWTKIAKLLTSVNHLFAFELFTIVDPNLKQIEITNFIFNPLNNNNSKIIQIYIHILCSVSIQYMGTHGSPQFRSSK